MVADTTLKSPLYLIDVIAGVERGKLGSTMGRSTNDDRGRPPFSHPPPSPSPQPHPTVFPILFLNNN